MPMIKPPGKPGIARYFSTKAIRQDTYWLWLKKMYQNGTLTFWFADFDPLLVKVPEG